MDNDRENLNFYIDFDETIIHGHYFDKIFSKEHYTKEEFIESFYSGINYEEKEKIYDSIINQFKAIKKLGHNIFILSFNDSTGFKQNISKFFGPFIDNIFTQEDFRKYIDDMSLMEIKHKLNITKYFDLNYMAILKILFIKNQLENKLFCLIDDDENICEKSLKYFSNNEKNCTSSFPIVIKKEKNEELDIILQKIIESKKSKKKMSSYEKIYNTFKSIQLSSTKQIEIKRK